jgi:flagellar motility protein MotE (MotC chaperone)
MTGGKTGSRLLSVALCALITVLIIKLAVTVIGAFRSGPDVTSEVTEAMAKDEKPGTDVQNTALAETTGKPGIRTTTADSLSALQQKELEISKKEEQLKEKEERLNKLEKEIEQKVKDLLALQKEFQSARSEKQENQSAKVRGIAKIFGTMKPKDAAKLMENLDDKLVMGIIAILTPDEAASILALMDVKKAAKISEALSGR